VAYGRAEGAHGDARYLAAALAHELWHHEHGQDEPPAYDEQVRVMRLLGIPEKDVREIEAARALVARHVAMLSADKQ
jgi:hypothetical protein